MFYEKHKAESTPNTEQTDRIVKRFELFCFAYKQQKFGNAPYFVCYSELNIFWIFGSKKKSWRN